ncbi:MAG: TIGR04219 family outer membrane beta-barrel protein [Aquificae bacterium]|nr:TIGR04219 family outer membrane beta-barrel protein [Aquificota bacterium]
MKKTAGVLLASGFLFSSALSVPAVDGEISAGYLWQNIDGWVKYKGDSVDVDDELNLGDENSFFLRAKLEHFVPLLPNLKFQYLRMRFEGDGTVNRTITFGDITVNASDRIYSKLELDHYDFVFYYDLPFIGLLQVVDVELGLNLRLVDFYAWGKSGTTGEEDSVSFVAPIPMLHGAVELKPIDLVSVLVEANGIVFQGHHYYDFSGELRLKPFRTPALDFFVGVGYKYEKLKIDDIDDVSTDLKVKQPYIVAGMLF